MGGSENARALVDRCCAAARIAGLLCPFPARNGRCLTGVASRSQRDAPRARTLRPQADRKACAGQFFTKFARLRRCCARLANEASVRVSRIFRRSSRPAVLVIFVLGVRWGEETNQSRRSGPFRLARFGEPAECLSLRSSGRAYQPLQVATRNHSPPLSSFTARRIHWTRLSRLDARSLRPTT